MIKTTYLERILRAFIHADIPYLKRNDVYIPKDRRNDFSMRRLNEHWDICIEGNFIKPEQHSYWGEEEVYIPEETRTYRLTEKGVKLAAIIYNPKLKQELQHGLEALAREENEIIEVEVLSYVCERLSAFSGPNLRPKQRKAS